ncbi:MAG: protein-(glutamine-N5) methyltransferase, release factor-specific [Hyphomicrobiales bacterium]|nr:MAG: protein-(glutamine-N5) methyltransferase, release factor-specific [Hyphomicrobiales bacterium]
MPEAQRLKIISGDDIKTALLTLRRRFEDSFKARGIDGTAALDARLLVGHACGMSREALVSEPERNINQQQAELLNSLADQRCDGVPIARLIHETEFWSLPFIVSKDTLVPRGDSEILVEAALEVIGARCVKILDVGTGTGCLALSLLHECPDARATGVDINTGALDIAQRNAKQLGLESRFNALQSDVYASLSSADKFDLIISNPPYIASEIIEGLDKEVRLHDPRMALDGGADGLHFYRKLLENVFDYLMPDGHLIVEIGYDQKDLVSELMTTSGFDVRVYYDLAQHPRVLVGKFS